MRLTGCLTALVTLCLAFIVTLPAAAQALRRADGLLRRADVQQELRLTDAQKASLRQLEGDFGQLVRELRKLPDDGRRLRFARFLEESERRRVEILTPEQRQRLHQIELQQIGVRSLIQSDIALDLQLTTEQRQRLRECLQAENEQLHQLHAASSMPGTAEVERLREETDRVRKMTDQRMLQQLTPQQRAQFDRMLGEPFPRPDLSVSRSGASSSEDSPAAVASRPAVPNQKKPSAPEERKKQPGARR